MLLTRRPALSQDAGLWPTNFPLYLLLLEWTHRNSQSLVNVSTSAALSPIDETSAASAAVAMHRTRAAARKELI